MPFSITRYQADIHLDELPLISAGIHQAVYRLTPEKHWKGHFIFTVRIEQNRYGFFRLILFSCFHFFPLAGQIRVVPCLP